MQRLPGTEERSPAPWVGPPRPLLHGGARATKGTAAVRCYGRSTLCTTVCSLSAGGQVHAGAVGHQRRAGRCAMQPTTPLAEERSPAPQTHTLCGLDVHQIRPGESA